MFYDRLQSVLIEGGFDGFAEATCKPYYATRLGAPSVPPGRYFRMHLVGYFEAINSERGLEWRCSGSLPLRELLRLESRDRVPDQSWLSKTRTRLPHEVHVAVFDWVLDDSPWKTRISEPRQNGFSCWRGDEAARHAVTNNRMRLMSGVAREAFKLRAEIVERSFAHNFDRGGMRRTWRRGRENVHKRYLLHVTATISHC